MKTCADCRYFKQAKGYTSGTCFANPPPPCVDVYGNDGSRQVVTYRPSVESADQECRLFRQRDFKDEMRVMLEFRNKAARAYTEKIRAEADIEWEIKWDAHCKRHEEEKTRAVERARVEAAAEAYRDAVRIAFAVRKQRCGCDHCESTATEIAAMLQGNQLGAEAIRDADKGGKESGDD